MHRNHPSARLLPLSVRNPFPFKKSSNRKPARDFGPVSVAGRNKNKGTRRPVTSAAWKRKVPLTKASQPRVVVTQVREMAGMLGESPVIINRMPLTLTGFPRPAELLIVSGFRSFTSPAKLGGFILAYLSGLSGFSSVARFKAEWCQGVESWIYRTDEWVALFHNSRMRKLPSSNRIGSLLPFAPYNMRQPPLPARLIVSGEEAARADMCRMRNAICQRSGPMAPHVLAMSNQEAFFAAWRTHTA